MVISSSMVLSGNYVFYKLFKIESFESIRSICALNTRIYTSFESITFILDLVLYLTLSLTFCFGGSFILLIKTEQCKRMIHPCIKNYDNFIN